MKAFKNLIEFVTKYNKHFYNRDIKCPVCGETMWVGDNYAGSDLEGNKLLCLACKNECCTMEIKYKNYILWDEKVMKANEAPEKIYINPNLENRTWLIGKGDISFIEYTRTDAFIEKACEYISEHVEYYMKKDKACNVPLCPLFATKSFIENFRKYMKG